MPFLGALYLLAYLDRANLSNMHDSISKYLGLSESAFGNAVRQHTRHAPVRTSITQRFVFVLQSFQYTNKVPNSKMDCKHHNCVRFGHVLS